MMMLKPEPIMISRINVRVSLNTIMILRASRARVSLNPIMIWPASLRSIMIFRTGRARTFRGMMMKMMKTLLRVVFEQRIVSTSEGRTSCAMATSNGYGTAVNGRGVQFPAP